MAAEDKEITLGAGKLLGLFFMLAATCGIFFAVGYSLGKTSAREQALQSQSSQTAAADPDLAKPTPVSAVNPTSAEGGAASKEQTPMTFYNDVKKTPGDEAKSDNAMTPSGPGATGNSAVKKGHDTPPPALVAQEKPLTVAKAEPPAPPATGAPQASASGTYLVQIAAVTHEEDAAALAGALRKKSYAAAVVPSPNGKDKLFHVVLGPYASLQDAEAMKLKLQGEGYSPIVKK